MDEQAGDVIKLTKLGLYGDYYYLENGRVAQNNATPSEYLARVHLVSRHFGLKWKAIGFTDSGQFVSRQQFVSGEIPTQKEVDEFLLMSNLKPVRQNCWLWKGPEDDGIEPWIGDARADNFVRTANGIVAIDLRMWDVAI